MSSPDLSVLLPARDAEAFLDEALASLEAQTFGDFEIVAVDDASRDGTREILQRFAHRDRRLRVVDGAGTGIADALNRGLAECRAPFVARMDADDVSLPSRFERQRHALAADSRLAAVGSHVEIFPRERVSDGLAAYERWLNSLTTPEQIRRECLVESPLVHPATLIRADALRAVGGWQSSGWPEDYALWLALLARGWELANVPEVLLRWRDGDHRLTRCHPDYAMEAHVRLKTHALSRGPLSRGRCILWGAGKTGRAFSRALAERGIAIEQFVDIDPRKIGRSLHGRPVIAPEALGAPTGTPLVAAVGAKGARALIREHLTAKGWLELVHFWCVG